MKMKTQGQQVIDAVKELNGQKGTIQEILDKIDTSSWKTKTPYATVASIISRSDNFTKNGKEWVYSKKTKNNNSNAQVATKMNLSNKNDGSGWLYLITVPEFISKEFPEGLPFKVGFSDGRVKTRIADYGRSLPYETISLIDTFQIPKIMDSSDYEDVENQVRSKLMEWNEFEIAPCHKGNQREWFVARNLQYSSENKEKIHKIVEKVINQIFESL